MTFIRGVAACLALFACLWLWPPDGPGRIGSW